MSEKVRAINYKVVIVGKSAVGKSSLLQRFVDDQFVEDYLTTIGVDFKFRTLKVNDNVFKLQIWDTAGQEKYQTITKTFYKDAHAIVLVYDLTSKNSFEDMKNIWYEEAKRNSDSNVLFIIVGNKKDQNNRIEVDQNDVENFAKREGILSFQASAKTGENVENVFFTVTKEIFAKTGGLTTDNRRIESSVLTSSVAPKKRDQCCN